MALVELSHVTKVYNNGRRHLVVDDMSLAVEPGQYVSIMGPSGSGKSTLLNLVAGLDRPTSGSVTVDGQDLTQLDEAALARFRRRRIGFVFQFFNLLPSLTVMDNVLVPAQLAGTPATVARERTKDLLAELGLASLTGAYPASLSGGERQRVAIARALVNRPALVLADEPTGALDSLAGRQVMDLLAELNRTGQAVLLITHDARLATSHAQRVISLRDGRIEDDTLLVRAERSPSDLVALGEARP